MMTPSDTHACFVSRVCLLSFSSPRFETHGKQTLLVTELCVRVDGIVVCVEW